jgi:hypothetical protein
MLHTTFFTVVLGAVAAAMGSADQVMPPQPPSNEGRHSVRVGDAGASGSAVVQSGSDAVVAPVKRVAPRTPVFSHGAPASGGKSDKAVVPARPNCDPGYKVDGSGKGCTKIARTEPHKAGNKKKSR